MAARSRSASGRITTGALPPSSMTHGLRCRPQTSAIFAPTTVEPVKLTFPTAGCLILSSSSGPERGKGARRRDGQVFGQDGGVLGRDVDDVEHSWGQAGLGKDGGDDQVRPVTSTLQPSVLFPLRGGRRTWESTPTS